MAGGGRSFPPREKEARNEQDPAQRVHPDRVVPPTGFTSVADAGHRAEVPRKDSPAWRDVQQTQTLALRLKDSLILNYDRLQGETQLVVSARGKRVTLQFALFAVPVTT